jgi:membrane protein DedA with SNARE-associated domain
VLNRLVDAVTNLIGDHGIPAVFFLMVLESACLPVPSEVIMLFAGYLVSIHSMSLAGAVAAGVAGNIVGSWIAWAVGMSGGRILLERHGRYVHITPERLDMADRWFERRGERIVLIARCLPIIRTFISLPAGLARMPFWRFSALTLAGCLPWVFALTFIGQQVGERWEDWKNSLHYVDYVVLACIVAGIAYLIIKRWRGGGVGPSEPAADAAGH